MKNLLRTIILCFSAYFFSIEYSHSQNPGVTVTSTQYALDNDYTIGWRFSTNSTLIINSLGMFDEGADGLNGAHQVGLWSDAGVLLASATIPAGVAGTLVGVHRYVNIAPVVLPPGTYRLAGLVNVNVGDPYPYNSTATFHPNVTWISGTWTPSSTLVFPINLGNTGVAYFTANFLEEPTVTPTLGQWGLIILGLLILSISSIIVWRQKKYKVSIS